MLTNEVVKVQILSIMLHLVRPTTVLLPLNIIAIWTTPSCKKDMSIIKLILICWEDMYYLTGQKNSWSKSKQISWWIMEFFSIWIHEIQNKFIPKQLSGVEFHHGKLRVVCQLIKSFVMLYRTKVSYTGDGYHEQMS